MTLHTAAALAKQPRHEDWEHSGFLPFYFCRSLPRDERHSFKLSLAWWNVTGRAKLEHPLKCYGGPTARLYLYRRKPGGWEEVGKIDRALEDEHAFRLLTMPAAEAYGEVDIEMARLVAGLASETTDDA